MTSKLRLGIYATVVTIITVILTVGLANTALAKTVIIDNNGTIEKLVTHEDTVRAVLIQADTDLTKKIRVSENMDEPVEDNQLLKVRYAKPLTVIEDGKSQTWPTTAVTYEEALASKNIDFDTQAFVSVALADEIPVEGAVINISNPKAIKLATGKRVQTFESTAVTAQDFLLDQGVVLDDNDRLNVDVSTVLEPNMILRVFNVTERFVTQQEEFPLVVEKREDASVALGEQQVLHEGKPRLVERKLRITFTDGKMENIKTLKRKVLTKGSPRVILEGTGMPTVDPTSAKAIAQRLMEPYGWNGAEFACLDILWMRESGWRWNADNPTSSAYGIPQSLPGSKMASAGSDWLTNPETQIKWGLGYISDRYGSPCSAKKHSDNMGWY